MNSERVEHTLPAFCPEGSRILILGTIPSPKSRAFGFYYGHPQNRFWRVISDVLEEPVPETNDEKKAFLERNHIGLWDVLASCDIQGASDSSIKNPVPNDFTEILARGEIQNIFTTGRKATDLYQRYCFPNTGIEAVMLPSTSPANCRVSYEALKEAYSVIKKSLRQKD